MSESAFNQLLGKDPLLEEGQRRKESYRLQARALSWEAKVASMLRMKDAFKVARVNMAQVRDRTRSGAGK
jgi:hypothetical protein